MKLLDKIKSGIYIVAEISANHGGRLETSMQIVHSAKEAGADCLKIQTYTPDSITIDYKNDYFRCLKNG